MRTTTTTVPQVFWRSATPVKGRSLDIAVKVLTPLVVLAGLVYGLKVGAFGSYRLLFSTQGYRTPLVALGTGYAVAFLVLQLVRTVLWWRYRPCPLPEGSLPALTVIIPAYNEGAMVEKALYSVAASDYPAECLEIICIDDGSRDDTWDYIERARPPLSGPH